MSQLRLSALSRTVGLLALIALSYACSDLDIENIDLNSGLLRTSPHSRHLYYEVETKEDRLEDGVRVVLDQIRSWIPYLTDEEGKLKAVTGTSIKRLTIATSNKSFLCHYQLSDGTTPDDCTSCTKECSNQTGDEFEATTVIPTQNENEKIDYVIVRVYGKGSDLLVNRTHELSMIEVFSEMHVGPKLFATFANGYVSEFAVGKMLEVKDFQQPYFSTKIASKLGQIHKVTPPAGAQTGGVWSMTYHWLEVAEQLFNASNLSEIRSEIEMLQKHLLDYSQNQYLTHNDLNHGNVIYDSETASVTFVDFEAACYSDRGFDLGNHFCEWAGLDLDFANYPSKDQQFDFLRYYLAEQRSVSAADITDADIEEVYAEANKYSLLSHLMWHVWSKIQSRISDIPYFDYEEYGRKRLQRYYDTKEEFLKL